VNRCQTGNPLLQHLRNVPYEFAADVIPDYVVGRTACALFLSVRYHALHPHYIFQRIRELGRLYVLRVLLVLVDVEVCEQPIHDINLIAINSGLTLILAWSPEEAARYLETLKAYENKPADLIRERYEDDYLGRVTEVLTSVRTINKTDIMNLLSTFGVRIFRAIVVM
jgi:DNA excision repair protein ERCC-1